MGLGILAAGTAFNFGLPAESIGTGGYLHGLSDKEGENFLGAFLSTAPGLERVFFTSPGFLGILTIPGFRGSFVSLGFLGPFSLAPLGFLGAIMADNNLGWIFLLFLGTNLKLPVVFLALELMAFRECPGLSLSQMLKKCAEKMPRTWWISLTTAHRVTVPHMGRRTCLDRGNIPGNGIV